MKKNLLLAAVAFAAMSLNAQTNIIKGGNMETLDAAKWDTSSLVNAAENIISFEFGFMDDSPTDGTGGCLHATVTDNVGGGAHLMFYQEVTLKKGIEYTYDFLIKTLMPMNSSWVEVYVGPDIPAIGTDYTVGNYPDAKLLGGFKWSGWENACTNKDEFDLPLDSACIAGSNNKFTLEGSGETSVYIGFKMGIWRGAGQTEPITIEFVIDNVSLTEDGGVVAVNNTVMSTLETVVTNNVLKVSNAKAGKISIFSITGQLVKSVMANSSEVNIGISELPSGMYIIQDENNAKKFIK